MKLIKFRRTVKDQPTSQVGDEAANEDLKETGSHQTSSAYYERLGRYRTKFRKEEIWITIGIYLILAGVAFVYL